MANKKLITFLTVAIAAVSVLFIYQSRIKYSNDSEYVSLELADHEKLTSGSYTLQQIQDNNTIATFKKSDNAINSYRSETATMAIPAITAEAIAKFLNGNLPTTTPVGNTGIPALLSQTGAFSNVVTLTPSAGLIPYDMIEPFWSDGAAKTRWMAVPNDGSYDTADEQITFSNDNAWDFPRGSVLIKHFEVGGQRLETRFEVKGDDDVYYYLTYKWNAAETDATLLNAAVDEDVIVNGVTQSWHYPSRSECVSCHFPQNGSVLGPKTRHLNKAILYPSSGITMNQLVNFSELGLITETITTGNVGTYPAVAAKDDLSASLEDRARSYIDVNCSSCHNPTVNNVAMFDARYTTPLGNQNIVYGEVIYDEGLNDPKVIIPQDVPNSMAHFRMNSTQTGIEMPPIAKDVVDAAGVQLIEDWINSLTPTTSSPPEALFSASTVNGPAPLSVDFDASASFDADSDPLTYSWDFGDGNTGSGLTINHVFTSSAEFTVTLIVSDGLQSDQATTTITVNNSNPGGNTVAFTDGTSTLLGQDNYSGLPMGVIDMNGDGKDDIVQFNLAKNLRIQYQNGAGQQFTTHLHGSVSNNNQWGTVIADFDHNGYNDVMSGGAYDNLKIVQNNDGNTSYTQSTLGSSNIFLQGANFADINNDGWADIFACHDDAESRAYENNQDGTLTWNPSLIGTTTTPSSDNSGNYASMWIDYDNDGDLDLYISKCRGGATSPTDPRRINMLWQNDGNNNYTEVAEQANLKIGAQTWLSDFGDIDNDGDLDAIIINHFEGPNLMRNNGDGTFTEITTGSGLLPTLDSSNFYGVQGFFKDLNNDGFIDLMVSGGNHYVFYNNGDGTFQNAPNPFNSDQIQSFSVGDINHDGFLDIYAGYANGLNSPSTIKDRIWLNQGNTNNFINIQLEGTLSNINAIGARVEIYGAWGKQIRDVKSGEGYGLVNTFTQHFGIGVSTQIDKVVVKWPSGIVDEVLNPAINQFLYILETEPTPTCTDGFQNGDETGVDCGGSSCGPCPPTCDDGIQNGDETGVDCGGTSCDPCPVPCTDNEIVVSITFDNYPEETSWSILDSNGATVASGGTYGSEADGSTLNIEECLPDGCYDFIINDSFGDGICCGQYGDGSYTVTANGSTVASGGNFAGSETTNFCVNPIAYTYNNAWSPSDPNNVSSSVDTIVVQAGEAVISMDTAIDIITVEAGAALTVNPGVTLTANTTTLRSTSQMYSSLILDGSITGTINYERHVNVNGSGVTGSNDLISAPLTGQAFNVFATANPNILSNTENTLFLFGPFNKTTGGYVTYSNTETATLDAGVGYRAASDDNSTFTFTGTANSGTVSYDIINSGPTEPEWNLVGNPYPSYLNVQAFMNHQVSAGVTNLNLMNAGTAAIYGYDGNALDDWTIYNLANTTASTVIAPGQGFFVSADATNAPLYDLEFTPAMRSTGTSDDFIIGRSANSSNSVLSKLVLSSSTKMTNTSIYFIEGTTKGLDHGYDASAYNGTAGGFAIFTNLVEDNQGHDIAIQSLPYNDFNDVVIPLGVKAPAGTSLTISIGDNSTLSNNVNVYLEDTLKNTLTLLNDSNYTFVPSNDLNGTGRFFLRYSSDTISEPGSELENILIYHNNTNKEIVIKGHLVSPASSAALFDIHGRLVINKTLDASILTNTINVKALSSGVYIVQLSNGSSKKTKKIVIN